MFSPSGSRGDRCDLRAELLERLRRDARVRAVRAVDGDPEAGQVAPEPLDDVLEVAVGRHADVVDRARASRPASASRSASISSSEASRQLAALGVEELDPVVLRRVVRGGDHGAEVEREQRDGGGRQHAGEDRVPARRCDALARTPPRARAPSRACRARRRRGHVPTRALTRGRASRRAPGSGPRRRRRGRRQCRSSAAPISAWRTAALCAPCAGRPSCARPCVRPA